MLHWREKLILSLLASYSELTTSDIVRKTGMSKVTALKYLRRLSEDGVLSYKRVGPAKLWHLVKTKPAKGRVKKLTSYNRKLQKLLKDFEEITGMKAVLTVTPDGFRLSSKQPE